MLMMCNLIFNRMNGDGQINRNAEILRTCGHLTAKKLAGRSSFCFHPHKTCFDPLPFPPKDKNQSYHNCITLLRSRIIHGRTYMNDCEQYLAIIKYHIIKM